MSLVAKDYRMMTLRWQGAPYFKRYGLKLVSKPAISIKIRLGGYRRTNSPEDCNCRAIVPLLNPDHNPNPHAMPTTVHACGEPWWCHGAYRDTVHGIA